MSGWAWLLLAAQAWAGVWGWRGDGTAVYPGTPPLVLNRDAPRWKVPLPTGNSSPVLAGSRLIATAEPTTLMGVDTATGRTLWSATNDWFDTVPAARKESSRAMLAEGQAALTALTAAQAEYSQLQRDARRSGGDPSMAARLEGLSAQMSELRAKGDAITPYITPKRDIMGWSSPTPVTDGSAVFALFGNGVVSSFSVDGARRWSVWLGPTKQAMRGWEEGTAASPVLVDGTLVVPYGALHGLDPATGALKWSTGVYLDFGTPAVATVGGRRLIVTPHGEVIDPKTGAELARGLGEVWYTSPVAVGDTVYFFGGVVEAHTILVGGVKARAVKLTASGSGVTAKTLWVAEVPVVDRFYAAPVVHGGLVYQVSKQRTIVVLDAATGAIVYMYKLDNVFHGSELWTNPQVVGEHVVVASDQGEVLFLKTGRTFTDVGKAQLETMLAMPLFTGGQVFIRTHKHLWAFGG
jgi:outer membrane protein assembly factor BamB